MLCSVMSCLSGEQASVDSERSYIFAPTGNTSSNPLIVGILRKHNGKTLEDRKVRIYIDGTAYSIVTSDENGIFSYQLRKDVVLSDGIHYVFGVDELHGIFISGSHFTVVDQPLLMETKAGNASTIYSSILFPSEGIAVGDAIFTFVCGIRDSSNNAVQGETLTLKINSNTISSSTQSNSNGVAAYQLTALQALSDGSYTADSHAQESNIDLTQTNFTVDTTAPNPPVFTNPTNTQVVTSSTLIVTGTAEALAAVITFLDGDTFGEITYADENGDWEIDYNDLAEGPHTIYGIQIDSANNESNPSSVIAFTVDTTP